MDSYFSPMTPPSSNALSMNEDSGYHTSCTPGSFEFSEISNENLNPKFESVSPKGRHGVNTSNNAYSVPSSPRRGRKRRAEEDQGSVLTPTSYITGGIQKLDVNDGLNSDALQSIHTSYPTTPVKKMCRRQSPSYNSHSIKSSPNKNNINCRHSTKKLNFGSPNSKDLSDTLQKHVIKKLVKSKFKPYQKIDIIKQLRFNKPAISKILSFLDGKDVYNFSLVNSVWYKACCEVREADTRRLNYIAFINNSKENNECIGKSKCELSTRKQPVSSLKDNNYLINAQSCPVTPKSPPGTPRTNKFKKYTRLASPDPRLQIPCVRCRQPAKVTQEFSGEEWAECVNQSCAFQFCKKCNCKRHPSKKCFIYDLEAPSPSKKKITNCVIGTLKCKRNLRRLLA